ncbi:MAG: hypothetical protein JWR69_49, partial [Pedosphaera sp.]|nr:hypothetical protein [Pedosphaera sp.]
TLQFQAIMDISWPTTSPKRVMACGLVALPLLLHSTNDLDRRYTRNLNETFLDAADPDLQGWLPGANGIFYSARLDFFYNTFYKNPQADWRYNLGFEPALMPDADLKVYRHLQSYPWAFKAYQPWIDKMGPADRLAIASPSQPDLPQLQWHSAAGTFWIGRLPDEKPH